MLNSKVPCYVLTEQWKCSNEGLHWGLYSDDLLLCFDSNVIFLQFQSKEELNPVSVTQERDAVVWPSLYNKKDTSRIAFRFCSHQTLFIIILKIEKKAVSRFNNCISEYLRMSYHNEPVDIVDVRNKDLCSNFNKIIDHFFNQNDQRMSCLVFLTQTKRVLYLGHHVSTEYCYMWYVCIYKNMLCVWARVNL